MKKKGAASGKNSKILEQNEKTYTFNAKELREAKKALINIKKTLLKEIDISIKEGSSKNTPEPSGDIYDVASNERDRELSYMLGDRERKKLKEIDNALLKIEEGTYGVCDECGKTISKKRLKIIPYSNFCITCQSNVEKEEKERSEKEYHETLRNLSIIDEDDTFNQPDE